MQEFLLIALGAIVGANCRFWLSNLFARLYGAEFPWGTLFINVSGSLIIGIVYATLDARLALGSALRLLLATGFCGGFTTFSTFSFETVRLIQAGKTPAALFNAASSFILGLLAALSGILIGGWLP